MGVVIRQSFFTSLISYAGVALGYINLLYLYPKFLNLEQIGLLRTILDFAILMAFFAQSGLVQSIVKFYPQFVKEEKQNQAFVNLILVLGIFSYLIFLVAFFIFKNQIISLFGESGELMTQYLHLALWLTLIVAITALMESFARTHLKLAAPRFLNEIVVRLLQGIIVTFYFLEVVTFHQLLMLSILIYLISLFSLFVYLFWIRKFKIEFSLLRIPADKIRPFVTFSIFSFVSSGAFILVGKIDSLMVTALIGFEANAIYTTAFYMAAVIEIPRRALSQANSTLMARAFDQNALQEISSLYTRTSINQLIIGGLLLLGIWANLHNIYEFMPRGEVYKAGLNVVTIIGTVKLIDMAFGPNTEMLAMSKYYWLNTLAILVMAVTGVTLNFLLIPKYGVEGAAFGSGVAVVIFNLIKAFSIYGKFGFQPFTAKTIIVIVIILSTAILNSYLPIMENAFIDLFYRSAIITIVFSSLILLSKSSPDINNLVAKGLSKLKY